MRSNNRRPRRPALTRSNRINDHRDPTQEPARRGFGPGGWYIPLCVIYDWPAGAILAIWIVQI